MAKFYPENYKKLKVFPTEWELYLLNKLELLSDEYEIFFNAYLNSLRPDIVILRKGYWVLVIEVKDRNLANYTINDPNLSPDFWIFNNEKWWKNKKVSPLKQVIKYKNEFFDVYISWLLEKRLENKIKTNKDNVFWMIETWIFLFNSNKELINSINKSKLNSKYKFVKVLNNDTDIKFYEINKKNIFFTDEIYLEFKRFLQPNNFTKEQIIWFEYKEEQKKLIISKNWNQKICWFPWSWKTIVLAWRAKNAQERHWWRVLILTYNLTLIRYIEQKIKNIWWNLDYITITNYHQLLWTTWRIQKLSDYNDINLFKNNEDRYDTILIDEIQDYEKNWVLNIKNNFLNNDWEFVVFWDEKQNIYSRVMDEDKKPFTWVPWKYWNKLTTSFRVENEIWKLANDFQKTFFTWKYEYDEITTNQLSLDFSYSNKKPYIDYFYIDDHNYTEKFFDIFLNISKKLYSHYDDICILWTEKKEVRKIDKFFRDNKIKTITTFETEEMFNHFSDNTINEKQTDDELDDYSINNNINTIERNKKINFRPHSWLLKISTIHSFKWWEIWTIFLIIDNKSDNFELIYTWITRTKDNLIVINLWNQKFDDFFKKYKQN